MAVALEAFPGAPPRDLLLLPIPINNQNNQQGRPNRRPDYIYGQLTLPGYITAGELTNAQIIAARVNGRVNLWKAVVDIAFLDNLAKRARPNTSSVSEVE